MLPKSVKTEGEAPPPGLAPEVKIDCFACGVRAVVCNVLHTFASNRTVSGICTEWILIPRPPCQASDGKGNGFTPDSVPFFCGHSEIPSLVLGSSSKVLINLKLGAWNLRLYLVMFQAPGRLLSLPILIAPRCSKLF